VLITSRFQRCARRSRLTKRARGEARLIASPRSSRFDSDAHTVETLDVMRHGVLQARRGWLSKRDVVNAQPVRCSRPERHAKRA